MGKRFSVVITTFNDKAKLRDCLESLSKQTYPASEFELVVVDDGSTDGTSELVREGFPGAHLITKRNTGADNSRNAGVEAASGEFVAFIDSDCIAPPDWLANMERGLAGKDAAIVGGPVLHEGNLWARIIAISDFGEFQENGQKYVRTIPTCNAGVLRSLVAGCPFHPGLRMGGDVFFCNQLRKRGHKLVYDPAVRVIHRPAGGWHSYLKRALSDGEAFVLPRLIDPTLPYGGFVKVGIPGLLIAVAARAGLDWLRLIRLGRKAGFAYSQMPAAAALLLIRRIVSVPGTIRAYRSGRRISVA